MKQNFTLFLFLLASLSLSYGQVTTRLVTITEGSPNNAAGLGQTFLGKVMNDGDLYFRGSSNGLKDAIWKTDGTIAGTSKLIEESNTFGGNWDQLYLLDEGFLINEDDEWSILSTTSNSLVSLPNLPNERISSMQKINDGSYIFSTQRDDDYILHTADATLSQITEIGNFHPQSFSVLITAGSEGAIVFNTNSFQDDFPSVFLRSTGEILTIEEYFATLSLTINDFTQGYIFDEFLVASYKDGDNFFKDVIIDMKTNTVADFRYIWEPIEHHNYGDELIIVTQREVVSINKTDLSNTVLFDNVFSFSVSEQFDDKLIVIGRGENFSENLVEINLTDKTSRYLDEGRTGSSFYSCKMKYYHEDFYYLSEDSHQILMKYDFDNNTAIAVDTLSINTGATVEHALEVVNNELVLSKRLGFLQHELYALGNGLVNGVADISIQNLEVYPSISNDIITLKMNESIFSTQNELVLYNANGQLVSKQSIASNRLDVSGLQASTYYGIIKTESDIYRIEFVKI